MRYIVQSASGEEQRLEEASIKRWGRRGRRGEPRQTKGDQGRPSDLDSVEQKDFVGEVSSEVGEMRLKIG